MAFKGHITLDGKDYVLRNLPTKTFVNQMAPAIGQGESKYADGTSWAAWIQRDWQEGNGKLDPLEGGGYLFGEVESRVPKQLILPGKLNWTGTLKTSESPVLNNPDDITGSFVVGSGGYERVAYSALGSVISAASTIYIYIAAASDINIRAAIYTNTAGSPGTLVAGLEKDLPTNGFQKDTFRWEIAGGFDAGLLAALTPATTYWLVIYPTSAADSFKMAYSTGAPTLTWKRRTSGTWATTGLTAINPVYVSNVGALSAAGSYGTNGQGFFRFNTQLYAYSGAYVYKWDSTDNEWDLVATLKENGGLQQVNNTSSAVVFGDYVYFSHDGGLAHNRMSTAHAIVETAGEVSLYAKYGGYLWRAVNHQLDYSDDATTWEPTTTFGSPINVGSSDSPIMGMCGMGESLFVSTAEGLHQIMPGDFAVGKAPWSGLTYNNGSTMVNHDGALYIIVNGRVLRYTEDQRIQDVWMSREDDMLRKAIGNPVAMTTMNNWLVVLVEPPLPSYALLLSGAYTLADALGQPTVWAMQGSSWHPLMTLPVAGGEFPFYIYHRKNIFYDRLTQRLQVSITGSIFNIYIPDHTLNPYNDAYTIYAHNAWIEWDWFDGNIFEVYKDYESVTIIGENLSATCYVEVYWMDDASTAWELLGSATSNVSTLRWDVDRGDRPNTRRFKLGCRLVTKDGSETPRIRAIRVKYMPMLRDWYQWNLQIDVAGTAANPQEGVEGHVNTRTAATIHDDLETIAKATGIFLYTDIDGTQYEVKVRTASFPYSKYEYNENAAAVEWEGVWNLTIEQTNPDAYVP